LTRVVVAVEKSDCGKRIQPELAKAGVLESTEVVPSDQTFECIGSQDDLAGRRQGASRYAGERVLVGRAPVAAAHTVAGTVARTAVGLVVETAVEAGGEAGGEVAGEVVVEAAAHIAVQVADTGLVAAAAVAVASCPAGTLLGEVVEGAEVVAVAAAVCFVGE